ncbi:lysine-rich arabinogalactan protein 19-like [Hordeum vulgare subsp. vulgare]|uniref:lysine-rich arabinogalactan protein 19-like n=1 Tax=Hordeum vulgare subsp. vulgare TaxID=112509 RepID=UPI001D1A4868|nr:lysine-rich arabinogalactan protein 19-like [Hordeum vulgare subsp. vulgare]
MAVPVTSTVATSATSPARQGDDPMDTDDVVSSQPGAICLDEGDHGRADPIVEPAQEPVLEPVLEAALPAAAPAANAPPTEMPPPTEVPPPTEPVPVGEEPTRANLGMPHELSTIPATRIADGIDLDTFVEPSSPDTGLADA